MSDSGGAANGSSWTILTPEGAVPETLRPVDEGTEPHEEIPGGSSTAGPADGTMESGAGPSPVFSEEGQSTDSQPPQEPERHEDMVPHVDLTPDLTPDPALDHSLTPDLSPVSTTLPPTSSDVLSPEPSHDVSPTVLPSSSDVLSPETSHDLAADPNLVSLTDAPPPSSLEIPALSQPEPDALSQSSGFPESPAPPSPEADSFSDSYTHISPSPEEEPGTPMAAETLGAVTQEVEGEGLGVGQEESELSQKVTEVGKQADFPLDAAVGEEKTEEKSEEGDSGGGRRRASLLAALERIGRSEEEDDEGEVEEFRLPQREEESVFSLNKCILGAIIMIGLGTIFFSESEYDVRELRDMDVTGKQEWLNPEIPPLDVAPAEPLSKMSVDPQQDTVLQAQLQAHKDELKVAQGQAALGAKERQRREEVEKENVGQAAPPPDSVATPPSTGQGEEGSPKTDSTIEQPRKSWEGERMEKEWTGGKGWKKEKEQGQEWKGKKEEKKEWKDGGKWEKAEKEWKKGKYDKEKEGKDWKKQKEEHEWRGKDEKKGEWKKQKEENKGKEEKGEWKKDKEWKEEKKWKEKSGKNEWEEKKGKHDKWSEEKEWKGKGEKKEKKGGKDEWREEKDWKKGKGRGKEWKDRKEWNSDKNYKKKDWKKEEWRGEEKPWQGKEKEWSKDGGKKGRKEEKKSDWSKDKDHYKGKDGYKQEKSHHHHKEKMWSPAEKGTPQWTHSHRRPPMEQPDYWVLQRERLQKNPVPPAQCNSVETCAQAEGLLPVPLPGFEALLLGYLAKAEGAGVEATKTEELSKLAREFFRDGVFAHDQMSFKEFVEDVGDILEDMVEKDDEESDDEDDSDSDDEDEEGGIEAEMEAFDEEVMKTFALPGGGEKEKRKKGEWKRESGRSRG